jgi:hypothetical protein
VGLVVVVLMDYKMDWRLSIHFFAAGFELGVEASCLESLEDLGVGTLGLAIAPGIGN